MRIPRSTHTSFKFWAGISCIAQWPKLGHTISGQGFYPLSLRSCLDMHQFRRNKVFDEFPHRMNKSCAVRGDLNWFYGLVYTLFTAIWPIQSCFWRMFRQPQKWCGFSQNKISVSTQALLALVHPKPMIFLSHFRDLVLGVDLMNVPPTI